MTTTPTTTKGVQYTTGTVHRAVQVRHIYTGTPVLKPACRGGRAAGANHYLGQAAEDAEITCKRCGAA